MKKIFAVSLIAMAAVTSANAAIVAESMLGEAGHYGTKTGQITVQAEIASKQATSNMVTVESGTAYDKTSTSTYPSMKTAAKIATEAASTATSNKADKATTLSGYGITDAYTKTETGNQITNAINNLDSTSSGTGNVVVGVSQTNGVVTVTKGSIAESDVTNLTTDLAAKEVTANKVTNPSDYTKYLTGGDLESVGGQMYPNIPVTKAIADDAANAASAGIANKIDKVINDSSNKNGVMVRNGSGVAMKAAGTDVEVANNGTLTVKHSKTADQIPVLASAPSGTAESGYAFLWVE